MIRTADTPSTPEVATQAQPSPAEQTQTTGKDFAAVHAAAVARDKSAATDSATPQTARVAAPEGETWSAEKPGAHYARILTGPRTGQYINLTHGDRRGQTFTIENRGGKSVHVYGSGTTAVVLQASVDQAAVTHALRGAKPSHDQPPAGERWAPVAGASTYADILEGPRNGLFVNISGGMRDGMAFQIVKQGDKVFHVYGTGKDKQMIQVGPKHTHKSTSASGSTGASTASTGGTTAASGTTKADDTTDATTTSDGTGGTSAPVDAPAAAAGND